MSLQKKNQLYHYHKNDDKFDLKLRKSLVHMRSQGNRELKVLGTDTVQYDHRNKVLKIDILKFLHNK